MKKCMIILAGMFFLNGITAQNNKKIATVLNMDSKNMNYGDEQMGNLLRIELEKLDTFQVVDRYDLSYFMEKKVKQQYDELYKDMFAGKPQKADSCYRRLYNETQARFDNCFSKQCLVEVGKAFNSDKVVTGTAERFGDIIILTLKLIDVKSESIEKTQVNEYLNVQDEVPLMIRMSLLQLLHKSYDPELLKTISKRNNYESAINNNNKMSVNLNGPRSGFTLFTGETARIIQSPKEQGGFNAYPGMFQFGYQFEKQYLNEGSCQALFEFIPTITGFNENIFIPSLTIMNGFRENKYGWEIAFGPTFAGITKADGYYDANGNWQLAKKWNENTLGKNPYTITNRLDSRGDLQLNAAFILAVGKTFKSGRLNIPVNFYWVPGKDGSRYGVSVGFNAKKKK
ncbi:MAG: hypothetical protein JST26_06515 [Bacteroidetes bacterium]|nr:hypothetical protein [Bacteroidota bacterium]